MSRTIAIGDIHGCSGAFRSLLRQIDPQPQDFVVTLGDYVDRGPDSKGVLDLLIDLAERCRLVPILGNHDEMMLRAKQGPEDFIRWQGMGAKAALNSYGPNSSINLIPSEHFEFLETCSSFFETETHLFLHANYLPDVPIAQTDEHTLRWLSLREYIPPRPHVSGKVVVVGHTPQAKILNLRYLIDIDTNCVKGGQLTALEVTTGQIWQAQEIDSE